MDGAALVAFLTGGGIGPWELGVILVILLLFFGRRVPEVMRSLGKGVSQFRKGLSDMEDEVRKVTAETTDETASAGPGTGPEVEPAYEPEAGSEDMSAEGVSGEHPDAEVGSEEAGGEEPEAGVKGGAELKENEDSEELAG